MNIPDNYKVLFLQGGASQQFAMIPMNLMKNKKAAYIITDSYNEVADKIMRDLDRGVTGLSAKGMYTKQERCVLYCVVSRKEIVTVKELVSEIDPNAFVIVSDVREVLGEGFQEYYDTI